MIKVLQLKISILGSRPPIWRRVLVKDTMTLDELHNVIQCSMGWENYHLFSFRINEKQYMRSSDGELWDEDDQDEDTDCRLSKLKFNEKDKFHYLYDFGDDWEHQIIVEKVSSVDKNQTYPFCMKAVRACPPEDCGGIWGYEELLAIMSDHNHEEHKSMLEWLNIDEPFDPKAVSLSAINQMLMERCESTKG